MLWSLAGKATVLQDAGGGSWSSPTPSTTPDGASISLAAPDDYSRSDAVLWSPLGKATMLRDAGGQGDSDATAINALGLSVGFSKTASGYEAVLWTPSGKATVLQRRGQPGQQPSLRHQPARPERRLLQHRDRLRSGAVDSNGEGDGASYAINASGQSIGNSSTASGSDAVLWSRSGKATVLKDAGGAGYSLASDINAFGWSVGQSYTNAAQTLSDAVLWSPSGRATALQDAGGQGYSAAFTINDLGWIVVLFQHRERLRCGAVVAVGESDGPWRSAGAGLERHECLWAERFRRHSRERLL